MIKLSLTRLAKEPIDLNGEEPADLLEIEPSEALRVVAPVSYRLHCRRVSNSVLVTGQIQTRVAGLCGRCLTPVELPVEQPALELLFENEEVQVEELDLTEDVRAEILLQLPMNILCSDDCLGLCPHCGANLNSEKCHCAGQSAPEPSPWDALDDLALK